MPGCRLAQATETVLSSSGKPATGESADDSPAATASVCQPEPDAGGTEENAARGQVADELRSGEEKPAAQQGVADGLLGASYHCMPAK